MLYRSLSALILATTSVGVLGATTFQSTGNPILADGSYYSADPAPIVVNDTLYILAGRDQAPANQNNFVMNEWEIFSTTSATPAGGSWTLYPAIATPQSIFKWAAAGTAYAAQIVKGANGKFYLYAPVTEANSNNADKFAIGVSVHDPFQSTSSTNFRRFPRAGRSWKQPIRSFYRCAPCWTYPLPINPFSWQQYPEH